MGEGMGGMKGKVLSAECSVLSFAFEGDGVSMGPPIPQREAEEEAETKSEGVKRSRWRQWGAEGSG